MSYSNEQIAQAYQEALAQGYTPEQVIQGASANFGISADQIQSAIGGGQSSPAIPAPAPPTYDSGQIGQAYQEALAQGYTPEQIYQGAQQNFGIDSGQINQAIGGNYTPSSYIPAPPPAPNYAPVSPPASQYSNEQISGVISDLILQGYDTSQIASAAANYGITPQQLQQASSFFGGAPAPSAAPATPSTPAAPTNPYTFYDQPRVERGPGDQGSIIYRVNDLLGLNVTNDGRILGLNFYDPQTGQSTGNQAGFYAPNVLQGLAQRGLGLEALQGLNTALDRVGVAYRPNEQYGAQGSNHGIDFDALARGELGTAYDWTSDQNVGAKGVFALQQLQDAQRIAQQFGIRGANTGLLGETDLLARTPVVNTGGGQYYRPEDLGISREAYTGALGGGIANINPVWRGAEDLTDYGRPSGTPSYMQNNNAGLQPEPYNPFNDPANAQILAQLDAQSRSGTPALPSSQSGALASASGGLSVADLQGVDPNLARLLQERGLQNLGGFRLGDIPEYSSQLFEFGQAPEGAVFEDFANDNYARYRVPTGNTTRGLVREDGTPLYGNDVVNTLNNLGQRVQGDAQNAVGSGYTLGTVRDDPNRLAYEYVVDFDDQGNPIINRNVRSTYEGPSGFGGFLQDAAGSPFGSLILAGLTAGVLNPAITSAVGSSLGTIGSGALSGALSGAATSALTGGDILRGALAGGVGGGFGASGIGGQVAGGISQFAGGGDLGNLLGRAGAGALGSALTAGVTGGDVGRSVLGSLVNTGVGYGLNQINGYQDLPRVAQDAIRGGATTGLLGGNAAQGALGAAISGAGRDIGRTVRGQFTGNSYFPGLDVNDIEPNSFPPQEGDTFEDNTDYFAGTAESLAREAEAAYAAGDFARFDELVQQVDRLQDIMNQPLVFAPESGYRVDIYGHESPLSELPYTYVGGVNPESGEINPLQDSPEYNVGPRYVEPVVAPGEREPYYVDIYGHETPVGVGGGAGGYTAVVPGQPLSDLPYTSVEGIAPEFGDFNPQTGDVGPRYVPEVIAPEFEQPFVPTETGGGAGGYTEVIPGQPLSPLEEIEVVRPVVPEVVVDAPPRPEFDEEPLSPIDDQGEIGRPPVTPVEAPPPSGGGGGGGGLPTINPRLNPQIIPVPVGGGSGGPTVINPYDPYGPVGEAGAQKSAFDPVAATAALGAALQQAYAQMQGIDPGLRQIIIERMADRGQQMIEQQAGAEEDRYSKWQEPERFARGGSAHAAVFARGGDVPHKGTHYVQGAGGGQDDLIDARLADGEYVFDADIVAALGDGSNKEGAKKLDAMREEIRKHKRSAPHNKIPPKAKSPLTYMKEALK